MATILISIFLFATLHGPQIEAASATRETYKAASAMKAGSSFDDCGGAEWCPRMIVVPAGSFMMGSPQGEAGRDKHEQPQHRVTLKSFGVGQFDITRAQYTAFMHDTGTAAGGNCYKFDHGGKWARDPLTTWDSPGFNQGGLEPVVCVSWQDAQDYAKWLSKKTGKTYRLVTEAEWEYAARAGTTTPFFWGDAIGKGHAHCTMCGSHLDTKQTAPVGSYPPNALGLFDMAGNVWQWVADCYVTDYSGAPIDGSSVNGGDCSKRMMRGAGWHEDQPLEPPLSVAWGRRDYRSRQ
jgi:formylglycine-generating enzyme required for sulfatase activity